MGKSQTAARPDLGMTALEAAQFLSVSPSFIRNKARLGEVAHFKLGSQYYFKEQDLLNLIKRVEPHNAEPSLD